MKTLTLFFRLQGKPLFYATLCIAVAAQSSIAPRGLTSAWVGIALSTAAGGSAYFLNKQLRSTESAENGPLKKSESDDSAQITASPQAGITKRTSKLTRAIKRFVQAHRTKLTRGLQTTTTITHYSTAFFLGRALAPLMKLCFSTKKIHETALSLVIAASIVIGGATFDPDNRKKYAKLTRRGQLLCAFLAGFDSAALQNALYWEHDAAQARAQAALKSASAAHGTTTSATPTQDQAPIKPLPRRPTRQDEETKTVEHERVPEPTPGPAAGTPPKPSQEKQTKSAHRSSVSRTTQDAKTLPQGRASTARESWSDKDESTPRLSPLDELTSALRLPFGALDNSRMAELILKQADAFEKNLKGYSQTLEVLAHAEGQSEAYNKILATVEMHAEEAERLGNGPATEQARTLYRGTPWETQFEALITSWRALGKTAADNLWTLLEAHQKNSPHSAGE